MLKKITFVFYCLGWLMICVSSLCASTASNQELDYLASAKNALLQVQQFNKSSEIGEAIDAISRAQIIAGTTVSSRTDSSPDDEATWIAALAPVLISFLAACVAVMFIASKNGASISSKKGSQSSPRGNQTKSDEIVQQMKYLVTDMTVPDELILKLRNEARRLRKR